jgi:hypothetical protein
MKTLPITEIHPNPNNPRVIREHQLEKLVDSLRKFPEMLKARPIVLDPDNVVLGGNMRLRAAQMAGLKEVPVYVADWEEAKNKEFVIKDNVGYGEWDWDMLANEWDMYELEEWGLNFPHPEALDFDVEDVEDFQAEEGSASITMTLKVPRQYLDEAQTAIDKLTAQYPAIKCRTED